MQHTIKLLTALLLVSLVVLSAADAPTNPSTSVTLWSKERAWEWYKQQPWIVGFNFVPSTACNTTEMWSAETFDAPTIDKELGMGAKLGFNSCRVFIQYIVWKNDPEGLKKRLGQFLSMAESHGISTTLVLFDDCSFGEPRQTEPYMGKQREPIPGMILPSWTPSPGLKAVADKTVWPDLEKYVKDIVGTFAKDKRVLMWDLYNEAGNSGMGVNSRPLVQAAFRWARQAGPEQPLTSCWMAMDESDVISLHTYGDYKKLKARIIEHKKQGQPVICTEWMARPAGSKWETDLPLFKQQGVGCYNWGLVNGRTQCQFNWKDKLGTPEPKVWFHDLFRKDGTPYDPAEHEAIRKTTADKKINWTSTDAAPQGFTEESLTFSSQWMRLGAGSPGSRLWRAKTAGETVTKEVAGTSLAVVLKHGPDGGIATVTIDGKPAAVPEIDTYSKDVDWNRMTLVAKELPAGKHTVVVTVTGRKAADAKNCLVHVVDIIGSETETLDPASGPSAVRIERDVAYLPPERAEKADLYLPPKFEPGRKYPGIVIIHGGGWSGGDKDTLREQNIGTTLASRGYVCMSVNYLLCSKQTASFPENVQDCKRAVRWLRKNAARFQLDAAHIGAIGGSAGGHLTALLATSGPETGIDPQEDAEYSCRIQAAVPMYPHCASSWEGGVGVKHGLMTQQGMLAKSLSEAPELWDSASPIKQLSKDDPPMLILHGTLDTTTPLNQSTRLHEAAQKLGIPCELIIIEGAGHSFHLQPKQRDLRPDVIAFFDKYLKPTP
jgi:acetyl esterase/lipase